MKVTINNTELDFRFKFKAIKQLQEVTGKSITDILAKFEQEKIISDGIDFELIAQIAAVGTGKPLEEINDMIDQDDSFETITRINLAFINEVGQYFTPNLQSQVN